MKHRDKIVKIFYATLCLVLIGLISFTVSFFNRNAAFIYAFWLDRAPAGSVTGSVLEIHPTVFRSPLDERDFSKLPKQLFPHKGLFALYHSPVRFTWKGADYTLERHDFRGLVFIRLSNDMNHSSSFYYAGNPSIFP
jgi:hypothetical protein